MIKDSATTFRVVGNQILLFVNNRSSRSGTTLRLAFFFFCARRESAPHIHVFDPPQASLSLTPEIFLVQMMSSPVYYLVLMVLRRFISSRISS
ncbi:hypothetical protein F5146DRAFT_1112848 [Armillaria mellea]|nr:hypothetical protein F5146DRAFT_1112848 [Armillaria mellea]